MSKQGFLFGTLILVGAGFINKILGFVYRIFLSRIIGDEGMGLFQMVFPILIFTLVITTAGIPIAISKLVSEAEAKGEESRIQSTLIVSILIVIVTSIVVTTLVILFAPTIAQTFLTDQRTIYALYGMTPIISIIAISSIFRGYFQGRQHMSPYAISQIIEQLVRIFTVLCLAYYLLPYGVAYAAAGAMIGMVIGEFCGMLFLFYSFRKDPKRPTINILKIPVNFRRTLRDLTRIAVPVTVSRSIGSLTYAVEPIVVSQSLALAGIATATATSLYGQLEGMAVPLVFFPAFITYALSVSLVPAISEAAAQNKPRLVEHRLKQAIRLSLIIGAPCTVIVYFLAEPLAILLYNHVEVASLIQIMAPISLLHYLQGPFASVLQGLDRANLAMKNSIIGAVFKIPLIFILASQPTLGIDGVAIATNCGIVIVTGLHFFSISKLVPLTFRIKELLKLTISILIIGWLAYELIQHTHTPLLTRVLLTLVACSGTYLILIFLFSLVRKDDVRRIPYIGKWLAGILPK